MADRPRQTYPYQQGNQPGKCSVKRGKEREREDPHDPRIKKAETQVHLAAAVLSFEAQVVVTKESRERRAPRATSSFQFGRWQRKTQCCIASESLREDVEPRGNKTKKWQGGCRSLSEFESLHVCVFELRLSSQTRPCKCVSLRLVAAVKKERRATSTLVSYF